VSSRRYNEPVGDASPVVCRHCDLLQRLSELAPGASARCPRCDKEQWRRREDSLNRTLRHQWPRQCSTPLQMPSRCSTSPFTSRHLLPVLKTTNSTGTDYDIILQCVVLLWSPTGWPLSLIVLGRFLSRIAIR
jgi:uncharacterized paraquat-inducible protein A